MVRIIITQILRQDNDGKNNTIIIKSKDKNKT